MNQLRISSSHLLLLFLIIGSQTMVSQERQILEGRIIVDSLENVSGIHVINLNAETGTTTNTEGEFIISAKVGDSIFFSSIQFENREILVSAEIYNSGNLSVRLEPARNELDEIQISDLKLSGHLDTDLPKVKFFDRTKYGIPYPIDRPTQTQRRLYTANANITSRWQYIGVLLGGVPLDVILNDINGKTKYLKKLDQQDKLQILVQRGIDVLGRSFFVNSLNLPESEIENFVYYCATKPEFKNLIELNNSLDIIVFYKTQLKDFINLRQLNDSFKN